MPLAARKLIHVRACSSRLAGLSSSALCWKGYFRTPPAWKSHDHPNERGVRSRVTSSSSGSAQGNVQESFQPGERAAITGGSMGRGLCPAKQTSECMRRSRSRSTPATSRVVPVRPWGWKTKRSLRRFSSSRQGRSSRLPAEGFREARACSVGLCNELKVVATAPSRRQ